MRLINVHDFTLRDFSGSRSTPPYAILSHTWGDDDTEVTYQDLKDLQLRGLECAKEKPGFEKIEWTCLQAKAHELEWAWVDTCCIDKSSSHELSEAINSMFRWYCNASVCYVYLVDVPGNCPPLHDEDFLHPAHLFYVEAFEESRWFTRGWTLQELLAPKCVLFFGQAWNRIAALPDVIQRVSGITGIQADVLNHSRALTDLSIARRLSWAANRKTTRIEDEAYSLLGIVKVNMPLLYGEGADAFTRLQEAIIAKSTDQSVFAWDAPSGFITSRELLLAPSPSCFANAGKIRRRRGTVSESAFSINNNGLTITLPILRRRLHNDPGSPQVILGILDCRYEGGGEALALVMSQHPFNTHGESRALETYVSGCEHQQGSVRQYTRLLSINRSELLEAWPRLLTITKDLQSRTYYQDFSTNHPSWFPLRFTGDDTSFMPTDDNTNFMPQLSDVYPERCWSEALRTMKLNASSPCGGIVVLVAGHAVLLIFGTDIATSTRAIYDVVMVHAQCPIEPHLRSLMARRIKPGSDVARIPLSPERQLVAHLFLNALTVSIEPIEERSIAPTSPPPSPTLTRASSSSFSSTRRRDSVLQDSNRSDVSQNKNAPPKLSWTPNCDNCQVLREKERRDEDMKRRELKKQAEMQKQQKKREKLDKQLKVAKGVGAGFSIGSLLMDIGDVDFL